MKQLINILVVLAILPLLVLGTVNVFAPSNTFELYGIKPLGIMTYSTFRGAIGGMLIGGGLIMIMGLITKNKTWYQASLLLISVILICRIISVIFDGYTNDLLPAGITELYIIIVMYFASKQLDHPKN
ncbi:DUF4345 family protein [Flavobacterium sp. F52]|uniref:DUF4345 family protein n=1 Tax=Flavobacterium sp. F52 TaxID=1202532 RepID=UPI0002730CAE|nr:DUF4345 family protein [Flavobacterium sp. F52]EJG02053.1 hypothetical protein FF52_08594 [Flavobacterium sp. F52]